MNARHICRDDVCLRQAIAAGRLAASGGEKMKLIALQAAVIALALSGCATPQRTSTSLTVLSEPSGAKISTEGGGEAFAPFVASYDNSRFSNKEFLDSAGCLRVKPFIATWPSGHKQSSGVVTLCDGPNLVYTVTIKREDSAPGREIDYKFGAEFDLTMLRINAAKERDDQRSADALWGAVGSAMSNYRKPASNVPPSYDCTSKRSLTGSIDTTCLAR